MADLVRSNDRALLSAVEALLISADIPHHVADRNMSVIDGSIPRIRPRVLVPDDREAEARQLLVDAEPGQWLRPARGLAREGRLDSVLHSRRDLERACRAPRRRALPSHDELVGDGLPVRDDYDPAALRAVVDDSGEDD